MPKTVLIFLICLITNFCAIGQEKQDSYLTDSLHPDSIYLLGQSWALINIDKIQKSSQIYNDYEYEISINNYLNAHNENLILRNQNLISINDKLRSEIKKNEAINKDNLNECKTLLLTAGNRNIQLSKWLKISIGVNVALLVVVGATAF